MRVIGYVRETSSQDDEPAFAQSERIRRWILDTGHHLVAVCQDVRATGIPHGRQGYRALLGIVEAAEAEGVVVPDLAVLASDKILQEIMVWDLRRRGVAVLSTDPADMEALADPPPEHLRLIVRDVLVRLESYDAMVSGVGERSVVPAPTVVRLSEEHSDVIVELIPPDSGQVTPAR